MTVTSITAVAVSLRTVTQDASRTRPPKQPEAPAKDSVELSQQAAAEARTADPSARAETLLKTFDTDGDGVVTRTEFTAGAIELLKRASLHFLHERVGGAEGADKRDQKRVNLPTV